MKEKSILLKQLFEKYLKNTITSGELDEFWRLIGEMADDDPAVEEIKAAWRKANYTPHCAEDVEWERIFDDILSRADRNEPTQEPVPAKVRSFKWYRVAVAASIILILIAGVWFMQSRPQAEEQVAAIDQPTDVQAPETNRAMITLADGSLVYLDELTDGEVAQQGNIKVIKLASGQIAYQSTDGTVTTEIVYNTLTNPRGSKVIDMKLSDGSRVWLNAGSSITYPVIFPTNDRKVELAGEGYFEVAHNPGKPFSVSALGMEIKVLGTHFNVNAYDDEADVRTTLLEGSVAVAAGGKDRVLKPGQQAIFQTSNSELRTSNNVDVEQVMAWKNGLFEFTSLDVGTIMRQAARWYDVDVKYADTVDETFSGTLPRTENLATLLQIMEATGRIGFKIDGKQVTVKPKMKK